ncbi:pentatricopeptide repeat-containing protein-like [Dorcoceras hygrometricum]|uniref:Pentatricopeptide repeat-containing protein-like n=1 Tax=Dorcoceras hygrometricum TaxID=472368 RepID=A0A2Z7CI07_9LAMI|nr:pentatricopeptide repeat-containing protein-like [Dorcoceras hygrometricum]
MKPRSLILRTLYDCLARRCSPFSSSCSPKSHFNKAKHFIGSSNQEEPRFIVPSNKDKKFEDSVQHLCQQKRLRDAVQLLESQARVSSAGIYITLLQLCIENKALHEGKRVHAHIRGSSFVPGTFVSNKILEMYCKCGSFSDAQTLFDEMGERDLCSWNTLISGYSNMGMVVEARRLFDQMPNRDNFSWTAMISASAALQSLRLGKEIHGHIIRIKLDSDAAVWSALLDVYGKCGSLSEARYIFDRTLGKDVVSWTTMIDRYFGDGRWEEGLSLFSEFLNSGIRPNEFTYAGVLNACASHTIDGLGRQVHGNMIRLGFDPYSFAASALVHMYAKCGSVDRALSVFKWLPRPDLVSWTSLIIGFKEAENIIKKMPMKPDKFLWASLIGGCRIHGNYELVEKVAETLFEIGPENAATYVTLANIYASSGKWSEVAKVRKLMDERRVVNKPGISWINVKSKVHVFMVGDQSHPKSEEIFEFLLFEQLLESGDKPDHITFVGDLSACTHAGFVDKGLEYFYSIEEKHGLSHTADHYAYVIDLLSRSGRFKEAENIIKKMPMQPDKFLWASLLGGCRIHGNYELAEKVAETLFEIEPENAATYVTLANIYASSGKWSEVAKVRKLMDERRVVKKPGISWINVKSKVHVFMVGDQSHPKSEEIFEFLVKVSQRMLEKGYIPSTNYVLHDEVQKEQNLSFQNSP